jgi:serine/threonine protein kinase
MDFIEFFPIYRDTILGMIFMHINNIAHRDIKPPNIMKMGENRYCIADYGEGINLNYLELYQDELKF